MSEPILCLSVRRRVDLLRVRQRTRQLARLLGLPLPAQLRLTAVAFEICYQLLQRRGRGQIKIELTDSLVRIVPVSRSLAAYEQPLEEGAATLSGADLLFAIRQLDELTPLHPIEEMRLHDQELLWLLQQHEERRSA